MERLLDIAAEVFLERGYAAASIDEIVGRANASKQTLYSRYPTKAHLFAAVMRRRSEAGFQALMDIAESGEPLRTALSAYAGILIFPLVDRDTLRLLRTIIGTAETFPEVAQSFWNLGPVRVHDLLSRFLHHRMEKRELRKDDPMKAAQFFTAMCTGRFWSQGLFGIRPCPTQAEIEDHGDRVVRSFLALYSPQKKAR